jgi:hypothetical protein
MSVIGRRPFQRMILCLPHSIRDYSAVEVAAELAGILGLKCLGAFIIEPALLGLGMIPGALELKSVTTGWQPIESDSLEQDLVHATDMARRKLVDVSGRLNVDLTFQLTRGVTSEVIASLAGADDIVVMIEPLNPVDRITRQFMSVTEAAFRTSSAVLLLPKHVTRRKGAVAVVSDATDDVASSVATQLSEVMHEPTIAVSLKDEPRSPLALKPFDASTAWCELAIENKIAVALGESRERLIVARRSMLDCAQSRTLAARRGVPVLVTGNGEC